MLFFLNSPFAFALETKYPQLPGVKNPENCTGSNCLPILISYWFTVVIFVAAILAVILLAIGGIRLLTSAGSPSARTEALSIIKGAILGLLLLMTSFLILRTINPKFIEPDLTPLPAVNGIFYANGDARIAAPMSESNTHNVPEGYGQLVYICSSGPSLFVWKFPKTDFGGAENAYTTAIDCGGAINITDAGSFKLAFETAGIYYCMGDCSESGTICSGYMSGTNVSSSELSEPFKYNVKTLLFVNDLSNGVHYGAVFHSIDDPAASSGCSPLYNINEETINKKRACFDIGSSPSASASIFAWNYADSKTSGSGVSFYSEPWGKSLGARAGKYFLSSSVIGNYVALPTEELAFDYSGINRPDGYKASYKSFSQHPGSIYLEGNYFLELRSEDEENAVCQIFYTNIFNTNEIEFTAKGNKIKTVLIAPTK